MTKLLVSGILAATVLAGGTAAYAYQNGGTTNFVDEDGDGVCDNGYYMFVDEDGDGVCDNIGLYGGRGYGSGAGFVDEDGDGVCDNGYCLFVDEDGDGICDNIGLNGGRGYGSGTGFIDEDGDGVCDNAGTNCIYGGVAPQDGTGRQLHSGNGRRGN